MCGHWFKPGDAHRATCSWECKEASKLVIARKANEKYKSSQRLGNR